MTATLYLILHKVFDAPAYDIAERCESMGTETDPGPWWIIPTSGMRAYPVAFADLVNGEDTARLYYDPPAIPDDWPDHWQKTIDRDFKGSTTLDVGAVLAAIGLASAPTPMKRRKL